MSLLAALLGEGVGGSYCSNYMLTAFYPAPTLITTNQFYHAFAEINTRYLQVLVHVSLMVCVQQASLQIKGELHSQIAPVWDCGCRMCNDIVTSAYVIQNFKNINIFHIIIAFYVATERHE